MKKISLVVSVFLVIICVMLGNVYATTNTQIKWGARLTGGVGNVYYYMHSSVPSDYKTHTRNAAHNWMYTGFGYNPIYLTENSTNNGTKMDIYAAYSGNNGTLATTMSFNSMDESNPLYTYQKDTVNWIWGKISYNLSLMNSSTKKKQIAAHEMGHVFGLRDINNKASIMHYNSASTATGVTKDAHDAINQKY